MEQSQMIDKYYYTDKEIDTLCKSIVILVDTREKENSHITDWFDQNKVPWKKKALKNGDYSFLLPTSPGLNIDRDLYFDHEIMVERKRNLDEIAGNFTTYRARFEEELATFQGKKYLLLENSSYGDVIKANYRSKLSVKSFIGTRIVSTIDIIWKLFTCQRINFLGLGYMVRFCII